MNLFSTNGILFKALNLIADIMLLHLLWIIFSLPIVTIGASTTALYYTAMKRVRKDEGYTINNFYRSFKENFKQSTIIFLILVLIGGVLYVDFCIATAAGGTVGTIMLIGCSLLIIPYAFTSLYIFPVQAKFENPIHQNFKNALLLAILNFGYTLILLFILATFLILGISYAPFIGVFLICGVGLYAYISSGLFVYIFRKYISDELEEDLESTGLNTLKL